MDQKQMLNTCREARLWIKEVILPLTAQAAVIATAFPDVFSKTKAKFVEEMEKNTNK